MREGGGRPADRLQMRLDFRERIGERHRRHEARALQFEAILGGDSGGILEHSRNVAIATGGEDGRCRHQIGLLEFRLQSTCH